MGEGQRKLKVLVVDDSAFIRKFIGNIIREDKELELVGTARDGYDALEKCKSLRPHVLTLDVDMPRLNGLETLRRLMGENPLPVVMVSSLTREGSAITIEALSSGAVDFVNKPALFKGENADGFKDELPEKIKTAARARVCRDQANVRMPPAPGLASQPVLAKQWGMKNSLPRNIVAIASSTGGPRALDLVFRDLPAGLPAAFFVTQHMPAGFTESLSQRLDRISDLKVREAKGGENIKEGEAYVAPGGYHLVVHKHGLTQLSSALPVQHVRPSADVMMGALAEFFGKVVIGVILTGMGRDGAEGMARIKAKGGRTIVQDPATAVIPSMPQAVLKNVKVDMVVPLEQIGTCIMRLLHDKER